MAETENKLREILFDLEAASDSETPQELIRSAAKKVRDLISADGSAPRNPLCRCGRTDFHAMTDECEPDARPHP
jgi:hypothetical protein